MKAIQLCQILRQKKALPFSLEQAGARGSICSEPSNSELRRWFDKKSILFDGKFLAFDEEVNFPVMELVFHPKGKMRCTMGGFHLCDDDFCDPCMILSFKAIK
jgi:hypothetical protein